MLIRPTQPADFPPLAALTNIYIRETSIHFGYDEVTPDELRAHWEKQHTIYPWLTAEIDGQFAGYAKAGVWRERAAYSKTVETGIYVTTQHQRRGIARALYLELFRELRERKFHAVVAGITLPNDPSVKLHESVGMTFAGRYPQVGWKFNQWHDVGFWHMLL